MIDKTTFLTSRDIGRAKLPVEEARNSFGYYIDIANDWETYRSPESLIKWFGIHSTHLAQFCELAHNLGPLSDDERDWARRYAAFYDTTSKLLSTTGYRIDLRYDIAETLSDWRNILRFKSLPARVLDFGAGCARQGVSAFLRDPDNIYVAVDGTLAGYTVQNLVISNMDVVTGRDASNDLLDFEIAKKPFPNIAEATAGDRFHVPVWLIEECLPPRFFDVIIAAHVHNELSGYDFMRLFRCIDRGLADDGVAYVRSELHTMDPRDFFDSVDLHVHEIVPLLREKGIVPIHCEQDTFLTTVFARADSAPHREAMANSGHVKSLLDARANRDMSAGAGQRFVRRKVDEFVAGGSRIAVIGEGEPFYEEMVRPGLPDDPAPLVVKASSLVDGGKDRQRLADYDPEVLIIVGHDMGRIEASVTELFGTDTFPLRLHYFYPIAFLARSQCLRSDSMFDKEIFTAEDVGGAPAPGLSRIFPGTRS
jgi:hypothetical protein